MIRKWQVSIDVQGWPLGPAERKNLFSRMYSKYYKAPLHGNLLSAPPPSPPWLSSMTDFNWTMRLTILYCLKGEMLEEKLLGQARVSCVQS